MARANTSTRPIGASISTYFPSAGQMIGIRFIQST